MSQDPIGLLLPDCSEKERAEARRWTTFLRLLASDARGERAESEHLVLDRARESLEVQRRVAIARTLEDLLRSYLEFELGADEYCWFGEANSTVDEAWSRLAEFRSQGISVPEFPHPGEESLAIAERLLASFPKWESDAHRIALWRARLSVVRDGPEIGGLTLQKLARSGRVNDVPLQIEIVANVAECLLTRGNPRGALDWLRERETLFVRSDRLTQIASWGRLLLGEAVLGVREGGPLPAPLCELRERLPEYVASLPGSAASPRRGSRWRPRSESSPVRRRCALGANVLAVFGFQKGNAKLRKLDAAPALLQRHEAWTRSCLDSAIDATDPRHALFVEIRPQMYVGAEAQRFALGGEETLVLLLEPILDTEGEVVGWMHLEFQHLAVPSRHGMRELACCWRTELLEASLGLHEGRDWVTADGAHATRSRRAAFTRMVERIETSFSKRTWWGFDLSASTPRLIEQGGAEDALEFANSPLSRSIRRAVATMGVVRFGEAEPGMALSRRTQSGIVLPIRGASRVVACLVIESSRRNDFRARECEQLRALAEDSETAFALARVSDWHEDRFGGPLHWPTESPDFAAFARRIRALSRYGASCAVIGPAGVGKGVVARWLHFEGAGESGALREVSCSDRDVESTLQRLVRDSEDATIVMRRLDLADAEFVESFERLARSTFESGDRIRWIVTSRVPLHALVEAETISEELALRLGANALTIPALTERREELVDWTRFFVARVSARIGRGPILLEDSAHALLWRQHWNGNLRELELAVSRLVLEHTSDPVNGAQASELLAPVLPEFLARIPSRRPTREILLAALDGSRTSTGRWNKTRAAQLLGWDPDTLSARMKDARIQKATKRTRRGWSAS